MRQWALWHLGIAVLRQRTHSVGVQVAEVESDADCDDSGGGKAEDDRRLAEDRVFLAAVQRVLQLPTNDQQLQR